MLEKFQMEVGGELDLHLTFMSSMERCTPGAALNMRNVSRAALLLVRVVLGWT